MIDYIDVSTKKIIELAPINHAIDICKHISNEINRPVDFNHIKFITRSNAQTIYLIIYMPSADRLDFSLAANDYILANPKQYIYIKPDRVVKEFAFRVKSIKQNVYVFTKPMGQSSCFGIDPNELMTAALCLMGPISEPTSLVEADSIISRIQTLCKTNKLIGYNKGQFNALSKDYHNLCPALSASKVILANNPNRTWDTVYMTSSKWPFESDPNLLKFNPSIHGMRNYNPSDFILKDSGGYLGISLKKKRSDVTIDPTLINNTMISVLSDYEAEPILKDVRTIIETFYIDILNKDDIRTILLDTKNCDVVPGPTTWKALIKCIPCEMINKYLKSEGTLFKGISDILLANSDIVANRLIKLIFKEDLYQLQEHNFDFALATGAGRYGERIGINIDDGTYYDINLVTKCLNRLRAKGEVSMILDPTVIQAIDIDSTQARMQYIIRLGDIPIAQVVMRYKGHYTNVPDFQAIMTPEFKSELERTDT